MIAPISDPIKFDSLRNAELWLKLNGFTKVSGMWIGKSRTVQVTPLLNDRVSIQIGVPA